MFRLVGGCLKLVILLVLLCVALVFGWLNRDRLRTWWADARGVATAPVLAPSPELAQAADDKLAQLQSGEERSIALSGVELESLLRYRYSALLPAFVDSAKIELRDGRIRVSGRVPVDRLPRVDELGDAAAFLPDTAELLVVGQLLPLDSGRVALAVDEVSAARIPLPARLVPGALTRLGRVDEPGLPADALALPLPPGAAAAYVRGDSLVLLANEVPPNEP